MNKKIVFVEPKPSFSGYNSRIFNKFPMLGPVYLGTILKNNGYDVKIYKENLMSPKEIDADILALSVLTSSSPRAYQIAEQFKESNPNGRVIMGGSHVSALPNEALKYADQVVVGEGENVILDLIEGRIKDKIIYGSPVDVNKLPFPDFSLVVGLKNMISLPISTSRGCPYSCKFCSVTKMFGRKYRFRRADLVIEEIERNKSKRIFFYDDNFYVNKDRTYNLLNKMKEHGLGRKWFSQTRIDVADNENMMKLFVDTGCHRLFLGLESINPKTLKSYNKGQGFGAIKRAVKKIKDYGIEVWGSFVLGSDNDDKDTLNNTVEFCRKMEIDIPQFAVLTPLPGTDLYYELEKQNRIFTKDWGLYDCAHVVFKPKKMSAYDLQFSVWEMFDKFYSLKSKFMLKKVLKNTINFKNFLNFDWVDIISLLRKFKKEREVYLDKLKSLSL